MAELHSEKLGYTSATILIWSLLLLNLYPIASRMQLPYGLDNISSNGRAIAAPTLFILLTILIALGATSLLLAVIHIAGHGLWLAASADSTGMQAVRGRLAAICDVAFSSAFFATAYALLWLPCLLLSIMLALVQSGLHSLFSIESKIVGRIVYHLLGASFTGALFVGVYISVKRTAPNGSSPGSLWTRVDTLMHTLTTVMGRYLLAIGVFIIFALWFLWFTHTAELRLSREIVYRSKNDVIEISVELGGATSQIHKAALTLKGTAGNELDMSALRDIGRGRYVTYLHSSRLSPGIYTVEFEYRRTNITSTFPFISTRIRNQKRFVVAE